MGLAHAAKIGRTAHPIQDTIRDLGFDLDDLLMTFPRLLEHKYDLGRRRAEDGWEQVMTDAVWDLNDYTSFSGGGSELTRLEMPGKRSIWVCAQHAAEAGGAPLVTGKAELDAALVDREANRIVASKEAQEHKLKVQRWEREEEEEQFARVRKNTLVNRNLSNVQSGSGGGVRLLFACVCVRCVRQQDDVHGAAPWPAGDEW